MHRLRSMRLTTVETLSAINLRNKPIQVILMEHPAVLGKPQWEWNEGLLIDNLILCPNISHSISESIWEYSTALMFFNLLSVAFKAKDLETSMAPGSCLQQFVFPWEVRNATFTKSSKNVNNGTCAQAASEPWSNSKPSAVAVYHDCMESVTAPSAFCASPLNASLG